MSWIFSTLTLPFLLATYSPISFAMSVAVSVSYKVPSTSKKALLMATAILFLLKGTRLPSRFKIYTIFINLHTKFSGYSTIFSVSY
jgi:hypothetical protein